jgi:hypothetical protein
MYSDRDLNRSPLAYEARALSLLQPVRHFVVIYRRLLLYFKLGYQPVICRMWALPAFMRSTKATRACRRVVSCSSYNSVWCSSRNMLVPFVSLRSPFSNFLNLLLSYIALASDTVKSPSPHSFYECSYFNCLHHLSGLEGIWSYFCCMSQYWPNVTLVEGKVIPVQAVEALRVARDFGSHIFRHSAHRWRQGCQPYAPAAFYP